MKHKAGFSPWHTKQNSFQTQQLVSLDDQSDFSFQNYLGQGKESSSSKFNSHKSQQNKNLKFISKTDSIKKFKQEQILKIIDKNARIEISQKSQRDINSKNGKQFDDEKWKAFTINSNDRFKSQCAQLRKCCNFASQLKYRQSSLRSSTIAISNQPSILQKSKEKPILQQLSIKNFIIQGHYTDKESIFHLGKRRDNSYIMKHKFATLKKTIDNGVKQNSQTRSCNKVILKGVKQKKQENLFKVIKLETEINTLSNNKIL